MNTTHTNRTGALRAVLVSAMLAALVAGCASPPRNVPFNIQSDPLGSYVMFQVKNEGGGKSDWIYLGTTPLITTRQYSKKQLQGKNTVMFRVMKEGYFDQTKVWKGGELRDESKAKGRVFWNPRLVPSTGGSSGTSSTTN